MKLNTFTITALLVVAVFAGSYFWPSASEPVVELSPSQLSLAKTYINNTKSWSYSEAGALSEILEADNIRYFSVEDHSIITEPQFYSHSSDNSTWSASARNGLLQHQTEKLTLENNVTMENDQTGERLETEQILLHLKDKVATSEVGVRLSQGLDVTTADKMIANLKSRQIRLNDRVRSIYVPQQTQP